MQNQNALVVSMEEVKTLGEVFVRSGFFSDARDASQAIVKILAGRELGFSPIASMTGVYIVKGKPTLSANMIAARIKASGRYDYRVRKHDATECAIEFFALLKDKSELLGTSTFTIKEAQENNIDKDWDKETKSWKQKATWRAFPRNMLFARAMSNGARWFCPDAFAGIAPYTPEELGAQVETDENGETVKVIADALPEQSKQNLIADVGTSKTTKADFQEFVIANSIDAPHANEVAKRHWSKSTGFDWDIAIAELENEMGIKQTEPE